MIKVFKINKTALIILLLVITYLVLVNINFVKSQNAVNSYDTPLILLDAGHGGADGGAVGTKTSVKESDLNLLYAKTLKSYFLSLNFKVKMIRESEFSLDSDKYEDMQQRRRIIEKTNADLFISIHMNKFSESSSLGAQVFYKQDDENSKVFAEDVRDLLVKNVEHARLLVLSGDFLVLNSASCPSILVECGFLSNEVDEKRLQTEEYRQNLCYQIFCGAVKFLNVE